MIDAEELAHLIKHLTAQSSGEFKPFIWGHVASYDPQLHRVRVIYPSLRDEATDRAVLSNWMQLGTLMTGNGYGIQFAPAGGASFENPTAGEQVQVHFVERDGSVTACAHLSFNQKALPPYQQMKSGELGIKSPGGSSLYFRHDGENEDVEVNSARHLTITTEKNVEVSAKGDVVVHATGDSSKVMIDAPKIEFAGGGPPVARVGDAVSGGRIVSGSPKVSSG